MIENIVISGSKWHPEDIDIIFSNEPYIEIEAADLPSLLVKLDIYKTTSEARRAGRAGEIPKGYTELKASKTRMLYIWNPLE